MLITGDIAPKGLDTHLKLDLSGLNITAYRPYFLKQGDLDVTAGAQSWRFSGHVETGKISRSDPALA